MIDDNKARIFESDVYIKTGWLEKRKLQNDWLYGVVQNQGMDQPKWVLANAGLISFTVQRQAQKKPGHF